MGRRIQGQRRGRGGSTFRAPSHRYKAELSHKKSEEQDTVAGTVVDIEHDPARSAPVELPLVVADEFEDLVKTREVVETLEALGVYDDIERADEGKTVKSGQGKTRGRKYKRPSSILFVTSDEPSKAARNLAGADVATAADVNAEDLAPGTHAGRLTVWTESALEEVAER